MSGTTASEQAAGAGMSSRAGDGRRVRLRRWVAVSSPGEMWATRRWQQSGPTPAATAIGSGCARVRSRPVQEQPDDGQDL
jgi:hypothetical protein